MDTANKFKELFAQAIAKDTPVLTVRSPEHPLAFALAEKKEDAGLTYIGPHDTKYTNPALCNLNNDLATFTWPVIRTLKGRDSNYFTEKAKIAAQWQLSSEAGQLLYEVLRSQPNTQRLYVLATNWSRQDLLHSVRLAIRLSHTVTLNHDDLLDYISVLLESAEKRTQHNDSILS
jgi:hypothetical protein